MHAARSGHGLWIWMTSRPVQANVCLNAEVNLLVCYLWISSVAGVVNPLCCSYYTEAPCRRCRSSFIRRMLINIWCLKFLNTLRSQYLMLNSGDDPVIGAFVNSIFFRTADENCVQLVRLALHFINSVQIKATACRSFSVYIWYFIG